MGPHWRKPAGPMGSAVLAAVLMIMAWSMARYQCRLCGQRATLTAGTIMQATKLPHTTWFQAYYLTGKPKPASPRSN